MAELLDIIHSQDLLSDKSVLFLYSDGGPDHCLITYISVQLSLISLFLRLDLDYLCAARTAPCHCWRNPAERMSIVNLGLQCVGLMRQQMSDEHEAMIASCSNTSQLRQVGEKKPEIIPAISDSAPVKILLSNVMQRLKLHDKQFHVFSAATEDDLKELWSELDSIDESLEYGGQYRKKCLESHPNLVNFISHCCQARHYSFTIRKCGDPSCSICKPV